MFVLVVNPSIPSYFLWVLDQSWSHFLVLLSLKTFFCITPWNCILQLHWLKVVIKDHVLSVISQKCESQNGCFKKTKDAKFSKKQTCLTHLVRTRTYQKLRNVCLSEDLACFVFLKHPFEIRPLDLIPTIFADRKSAVSYHCFERTFRVLWWKSK